VTFDDPSFEYKDLLELKTEKIEEKFEANDLLLDFGDEQQEVPNNNNNNAAEENINEELRNLKKFVRDLKLGCKCWEFIFFCSNIN